MWYRWVGVPQVHITSCWYVTTRGQRWWGGVGHRAPILGSRKGSVPLGGVEGFRIFTGFGGPVGKAGFRKKVRG